MSKRTVTIGVTAFLFCACGSEPAREAPSDPTTGPTRAGQEDGTSGDPGGFDASLVTDAPASTDAKYVDGFGWCTPGATQCTDCADNDGDGKIDWQDPECTGPLDDDEATFGTGIPGDNKDPCKQDCFFDGNSGQGDDGCNWDLRCDPKTTVPPAPKQCAYDPGFKCQMQTPMCIKVCKPYAPNGCDCFGCCEVPGGDGGSLFVKLSQTCTLADVNDPMKCPPCTPTKDCFNPCDECELCLGKLTLPPSCMDAGASCPMGQTACDEKTPCPNGYYCLTGCCVPIPPK